MNVETLTAMRPLGDRVLVKICKADDVSRGGIYIPDVARERPVFAEVIGVGEDVSAEVQPGQRVVFPRYAGTEVTVDGDDKFVVLEENDLEGVVEA